MNKLPDTEANSSPSSVQTSRLSLSDYVFLGFIGVLLSFVVLLSQVRNRPSPFAVSLLAGSAISLLSYHFLGGLHQEDANLEASIGGIKVKFLGSIAALIGATAIINPILERQMRDISLEYRPKQPLLIADQDGKVQKVEIIGTFGGVEEIENLEVPNDVVKRVQRVCQEGKGFCESELLDVQFQINSRLNSGFARVCERHPLNLYPVAISSGKLGSEAIRVMIIADRICVGNPIQSMIEISPEDGDRLKVVNGDNGWAETTPLIMTTIPSNVYRR